jgi:DNA-binding response OmpR family regulator
VDDAEKSILIVDDDDAIRLLLRTILQRRGLVADSARDGREALECLKRSRYAVMLLDLMMPRGSGWDVLGEIAQWPLDQRPITIVITAGTEPRTLDPSLVAGTVRKPFDIEMLTDTVAACVRNAPSRRKQHPDDQPSATTPIVN